MTDERKLGRVPSRTDPRTLRLARYLDHELLPAAPPARDWAHPLHAPAWGMFGNDVIGDCTCAAIAHLMQASAANTGRSCTLQDADVVGLYERVGHYDPARPETDQGAEMIDVLRALRAAGGGLGGRRISAFAAVDLSNRWHVEAAVNLFGGVYVGVDLPLAAKSQTVWDIAPAGVSSAPGSRFGAAFVPGSWGPHSLALLGYDRRHVTFVTWGAIRIATLEWFRTYVSEAWAMIDPLWVDTGLSPSGFDLAALRSDLVNIDRAA